MIQVTNIRIINNNEEGAIQRGNKPRDKFYRIQIFFNYVTGRLGRTMVGTICRHILKKFT
jgi:hypothetical protein